MDYWGELTHNRNRLVVKLLWGFYLSTAVMLWIKSGISAIDPPIGLIVCIIVSGAVYRKKNPIFTMYFIMSMLFLFFFSVILRYPYFINVIFVWLILILSSLYQQYRVIILSGIYSIGLTIYAFTTYGTQLVKNFGHIEIVYLVMFGAFVTAYICFYTKFTTDLWVKEKRSEQQLKSILDSVKIIAWSFDVETRKMAFSDGIAKLTHYKKEEFVEKPNLWKEIIRSEDEDMLMQYIKEIFEGQSKILEVRISTKKGKEKWIQVRTNPITDHNGKIIYVNGVVIDITQRKHMEEEIKYMAYHDVLTELPNRTQFNEHFAKVLFKAKSENKKMAVLFIDLDQFKTINDTLGHDIGDMLLKEAAKRLKNTLRESDFVCRIGGDEFVILLNDIAKDQVDVLAQRIIDTFTNAFVLQSNRLFITPSIGISIYPNHGSDVETLIKNADDAMYLAKKNGKNNYKFYDPTKLHA